MLIDELINTDYTDPGFNYDFKESVFIVFKYEVNYSKLLRAFRRKLDAEAYAAYYTDKYGKCNEAYIQEMELE